MIFIYTTAICVIAGEVTLRMAGYTQVYFDNMGGKYLSPYDNTIMWPRTKFKNVSFTRKKTEFEYRSQFNSEGLRDIEQTKSKPKGEYRILLLGDSFTEGFGVEYDDTWCSVLKRKLNKDSTNRVNIINGGFSGSDPFFSYHIFKEHLISYNPDLVYIIKDFIILTSENSIDLAVIFHPYKREILSDRYEWDFDFIKSELMKNNIKFYDLLEFFQGKIDADNIYEYYWKEDGHFTPKGNVIFAKGIENFILNSNYLPEKLK